MASVLRPLLASTQQGIGALETVAESVTSLVTRSWRLPRWNFSRHAATFRNADAFVVSIPKSGRTWVRVFLAAYFSELSRQPPFPRMPRHAYTHDLWEHDTKGKPTERLRGKWLIPRGQAARKPILLVARDPRDVMVSLFFQLRNRTRTYDGDLPELLHHPTWGVRRVVEIMNRWLAEWDRLGGLHLLRYEDAMIDPAGTFSAALRFLAPKADLDPAILQGAIEIACFDNMRRLEVGDCFAAGAEIVRSFREQALGSDDTCNPDSFKVRRGKVGGFVDYLAATDIDFLNEEMARLHPRYGYRPD